MTEGFGWLQLTGNNIFSWALVLIFNAAVFAAYAGAIRLGWELVGRWLG